MSSLKGASCFTPRNSANNWTVLFRSSTERSCNVPMIPVPFKAILVCTKASPKFLMAALLCARRVFPASGRATASAFFSCSICLCLLRFFARNASTTFLCALLARFGFFGLIIWKILVGFRLLTFVDSSCGLPFLRSAKKPFVFRILSVFTNAFAAFSTARTTFLN